MDARMPEARRGDGEETRRALLCVVEGRPQFEGMIFLDLECLGERHVIGEVTRANQVVALA
jgi:hypothetical protein